MRSGADRSPLVSFNLITTDPHFAIFSNASETADKSNHKPNPNLTLLLITDPQICKLSPLRSAPLRILSRAVLIIIISILVPR